MVACGAVMSSCGGDAGAAGVFYRSVLEALDGARVPFLVGGAFAFTRATGIRRGTKDLDLFLRRADIDAAFAALRAAGLDCETSFAHWLAKAHRGEVFVDLIFGSGNGLAEVDDEWFRHAGDAELLGRAVRTVPVEEAIWSKAFVMERERYDGADVAHLLRACAPGLDWARLVRRFGAHWRVLLAHLVLFGFIYPQELQRLPPALMRTLLERAAGEHERAPPPSPLCRGTLLSREQYLVDVEQLGYRDARLAPYGPMSAEALARWTAAIG